MMMEKQLGAAAASSWEQQQLNLPRLQTKQKQKQQQQQVVDSSQSLDQPDLEPLTPIGSMFLNPEMEFYGFCVIGFQNLVDLEELKQTLRNTLLKQKYFSSIVKKNKREAAMWVPLRHVDMDALVFEPSGISEAEMAAPGFVDNYVADLATAPPLSLTRPLWECHVLNGTSGSNATAHAVFRMHHCLGDGISVMSLVFASTRQTANPEKQPSIRAAGGRKSKKQEIPHDDQKHQQQQQQQRIFTCSVLGNKLFAWWNRVLGAATPLATLIWVKDSNTVLRPAAGGGGGGGSNVILPAGLSLQRQPKRLAHATLNLDDMRVVKNAVGGTVNDVFLAMLDASLHRYLQNHYHKELHPPDHMVSGSAKKQETQHNIMCHKLSIDDDRRENYGGVCQAKKASSKVKKLRVRTALMENTRELGGLQELPAMMEKGSKVRWGNCIGFSVFQFSLKCFSDPLDLVRAAVKEGNRIKAFREGHFTFWFGTLLSQCGLSHLSKTLFLRTMTQTSLLVSNLPGPVEQIMLGNNPIVHMFPVVAGIPQSLCVYMQSYVGKVTLVVMSAKHIIPDPEKITQYCIDALEEMKLAALSLKV